MVITRLEDGLALGIKKNHKIFMEFRHLCYL